MKKFFALLTLFFVSFALFPVQPAMAGPALDQSNTKIGTSSLLMDAPYYRAQTFRPAKQHLDQVDIYLRDRVKGSWSQVYIYDELTHQELANSGHRLSDGDGWEVYPFNLDVIPGARYRIKLLVKAIGVKWPFTTGNLYTRGTLYYEENTYYTGADLNFRTWGTDPVEMVEEQTVPEEETQTQTPATIPGMETSADSAEDGAATPVATTTSSIAKPTELKAEYSAGAKLTWKASATSDITGYIIFRSETKGKGYAKIANVAKNILEYTDSTVVASTTYYYVVRAAKGVEHSASSNEASLDIPADAAPIAPLDLKVAGVGSDYITVSWTKNPETNLSGYTITILKGSEVIKTAEINSDRVNYYFGELTKDTDYKVTLTAKNSAGKESSPSEVITKTLKESDPIKNTFSLLTMNLIGAASILIILLIWLVYHRKLIKGQATK